MLGKTNNKSANVFDAFEASSGKNLVVRMSDDLN
jgi:hypothetical protein